MSNQTCHMNVTSIFYAITPTIMSNQNEGKTKTRFGFVSKASLNITGHQTMTGENRVMADEDYFTTDTFIWLEVNFFL